MGVGAQMWVAEVNISDAVPAKCTCRLLMRQSVHETFLKSHPVAREGASEMLLQIIARYCSHRL